MNKAQFLEDLRSRLSGLPRQELDERLVFYSEMIDDRIEDGLDEEAAVAEIGPADKVARQIMEDIPLSALVKERVRSNRSPKAWEIVLLVLGFPLWFPLLIAAGAVLLSLYAVLWALVLSLWAVEFSLIVSAFAGVAGGIFLLLRGSAVQGLTLISAGLVLAGLAIFLFYGCVAAVKGSVQLTKKLALGLKSLFVGKERTK